MKRSHTGFTEFLQHLSVTVTDENKRLWQLHKLSPLTIILVRIELTWTVCKWYSLSRIFSAAAELLVVSLFIPINSSIVLTDFLHSETSSFCHVDTCHLQLCAGRKDAVPWQTLVARQTDADCTVIIHSRRVIARVPCTVTLRGVTSLWCSKSRCKSTKDRISETAALQPSTD